MYGSSTYGQSEYGGFNGIISPAYYAVFEGFVVSEIATNKQISRSFLENLTVSEVVTKHTQRTFDVENFSINDISVRPILNGQTATWIRIPRGRTTWNSLPKN